MIYLVDSAIQRLNNRDQDNYLLSMGTERIANILSLDTEKVGAGLKNLAGKTNPLAKLSSSLVQAEKRHKICLISKT